MIYVNHRDHNDNNVTEEAHDIDHAFNMAKDLLQDEVAKEVYILTDQFKYRITNADFKTLVAGTNNVK